jgi:hypothetical protein
MAEAHAARKRAHSGFVNHLERLVGFG